MASPDSLAPVEAAFAKIGATLLDEHKAELEKMIEGLADSDAAAVMNALASHVELHGLASAAQTPIRNAITGSEPDVERIINSNIAGGFDSLESWLQKVAAGAGTAP